MKESEPCFIDAMASSFYKRVYEAVRQIPYGKVATYGQIACMAGSPRASRVVGYALHGNPQPGVIPCHRVVNRDGRVAPAFAFGGPGVQQAMLEAEGIVFDEPGHVNLKRYRWNGETHETV